MKVSTITSSLFGLLVISVSNVLANSEYFKYPPPDSTYSPGEYIQFLARETPDFDKHTTVDADLYSESGDFVTRIKSFYGEYDDDNLAFRWKVSPKIIPGRYYVQLTSSKDYEDTTRSYTFNIEDDDDYDREWTGYYRYQK